MNSSQKWRLLEMIKSYGFNRESQGVWSTINACHKDNPDSREQEAKEKSEKLFSEISDIVYSIEDSVEQDASYGGEEFP